MSEVEGRAKSELERLRALVFERLRRGELPYIVYSDYLVQLVELLNDVFMSLEPSERPLFHRTFEELVGRYFISSLGIPPPSVKFFEMTPREYVEKVFQYTYELLRQKTPAQTEHEVRQNIELRTSITLIKPIEKMLKLTAPKEIA
jgi:hypothetical protein